MKGGAVTGWALAAVLAAGAGAAYSSRRLEQMRAGATLEDVMLVRSPKLVKVASLGYTGLAADIYWTRAVQYFGGKHHEKSLRYDLLRPLLELTTDLDPQLTVAYEFGSFFLAQKPPEGAGDPQAAVELVKKGIAANPQNWRLYYHLGFVEYVERKDLKAAADAFEEGAKIAGAPAWMKVMAAAMRQKGGERETARYLWTNIYESSNDPLIKQNAVYRLMALRIDEDVTRLEEMAAEYKRRTGAYPTSWQQLMAMGWLRGVPADPSRTPYRLMAEGRVEVQEYRRFPFLTKGLPPGAQSVERITEESFQPQQ
jgi:tetratricopeptide (TPR) repeat protein